ncbi:MAG: hypothetical protein NTX73_13655 [Rhodobacterales bacterium]|nr:hypothetical protein [Rhodobacterales bacterium]
MKTAAPKMRLMLAGATTMLVLAALASQSKPGYSQTLGLSIECTGSLPNGWSFTAEALDERFLHIIWSGPQEQTRVSVMTAYSTNADGSSVFRGTLFDAIEVTLVDTSGGNPSTGTEVEIYAEEWGWFSGACVEQASGPAEKFLSSEVIRQNLVGTRDTSATNWLRRNNFVRVQVITHSSTGKTERWQQDPAYPVDIQFLDGRVFDVVSAVP